VIPINKRKVLLVRLDGAISHSTQVIVAVIYQTNLGNVLTGRTKIIEVGGTSAKSLVEPPVSDLTRYIGVEQIFIEYKPAFENSKNTFHIKVRETKADGTVVEVGLASYSLDYNNRYARFKA